MAADVSYLFRVLSGYKDDRTATHEAVGGDSMGLSTRDLLGGGGDGSSEVESQELDLDLHVPSGWEKRLDLKSGQVYLQKCNSSDSPSSSSEQTNQTVSKLQDLNFSPSPSKLTLNLFDESSLELNLASSSSSAAAATTSSSSNYQSVCTLDKVKFALERAEKEPIKKRSWVWKSSLSPSYSSSSSSIKEEKTEEKVIVPSAMAVGCPGCLSYVLIMKNNPKCPRCNTVVALPLEKKPRIDLNISI